MKKLLFVALISGLLSVSASAGWVEGKILKINKLPAGTYVTLKKVDNSTAFAKLTLTGDARKEFLAVLLTAKAQNATIKLFARNGAWAYYEF